MVACAFHLDDITQKIPGLTILQAKAALVGVGILVVGCGWLGFRLAGIPFAKRRPIQPPVPTRGSGP
ncbi:hypothetical protein Oter_2595 [Opitutus terrae PB90-1]|uniref:Uncharacterized protein n=2 Tax=Opitutus terrae TaxID=107709 RepID=B1ZTZ5_OPITP|nr:hypothetical protein Oter_2595 [Opitutus terrae PB90-1]